MGGWKGDQSGKIIDFIGLSTFKPKGDEHPAYASVKKHNINLYL